MPPGYLAAFERSIVVRRLIWGGEEIGQKDHRDQKLKNFQMMRK
jgi:hypothetical protein